MKTDINKLSNLVQKTNDYITYGAMILFVVFVVSIVVKAIFSI